MCSHFGVNNKSKDYEWKKNLNLNIDLPEVLVLVLLNFEDLRKLKGTLLSRRIPLARNGVGA